MRRRIAGPRAGVRARRRASGTVAAVVALGVMAAACGGEVDTASTRPASTAGTVAPTSSVSTVATAPAPSTQPDVTTTAAPTTPAPTTPAATTAAVATTLPVGLEQPAIWPAADVVFATPIEAAADFVAHVLRVPPSLGEFRQGDSRSGEIEVFSPGEGAAPTPVPRSLLLLRQLGPNHGWFVTAAVNEHASITAPAYGSAVPAGPLTVEGVARGFEANVNVTARLAGTAEPLAEQVTMGGSAATAEPFAVTLDLSAVTTGQVIMLLVRGGVGLETDPGDFGAIPIVIG